MLEQRSRAPGHRRLVLGGTGLIVITTSLLAGCSGSSGSNVSSSTANGAAAPARAGATAGGTAQHDAASGAQSGAAGSAQSQGSARLAPAGQQLIYTAQLTVRARNVDAAVSSATSIVTGAGGYVSNENSSANPSHPALSTATLQLKIPVARYSGTLSQLAGAHLGTQLSLQQQAQDVTEQVADVNSQVTSDEAAISQLRTLLTHAGSVADLLSVQNQINTEESALEAMQAEQSALNHETAYATVTLTVLGPLATPRPTHPKPPPGLASGLSGGWHALRVTLSWLLAIAGAVAPFAAIIAIIGYLGYRARRWFLRRGLPRPSPADN